MAESNVDNKLAKAAAIITAGIVAKGKLKGINFCARHFLVWNRTVF